MYWREQVANVRLHDTTRERPVDRFQKERSLLRPLPTIGFDTDEVVAAIVSPLAQIEFDGNRYSVPPAAARQTVLVRANATQVRVLAQGRELACHVRCYQRGQRICQVEHQLAALQLRQRTRARDVERTFDALGPEAREFHLQLRRRPLKTTVHLRRLLNLVQLYGRADVLAAIALRISTRPTTRPTSRPWCCRSGGGASCRRPARCVLNDRNCSRRAILKNPIPESMTPCAKTKTHLPTKTHPPTTIKTKTNP